MSYGPLILKVNFIFYPFRCRKTVAQEKERKGLHTVGQVQVNKMQEVSLVRALQQTATFDDVFL